MPRESAPGAARQEPGGRIAPPPSAGPFVLTHSGRHVPLLAPTPYDIDLADIAHGLALLCRWNGHTSGFLSVAQHSLAVADLVAQAPGATSLLILQALMHDAAEAYLGDWPRPVQWALPFIAQEARRDLHDRFDAAIATRFGYPIATGLGLDRITLADDTMLATERRDLLPATAWTPTASPSPRPIKLLPWPRAEELFIEKFRRLATLAGIKGE